MIGRKSIRCKLHQCMAQYPHPKCAAIGGEVRQIVEAAFICFGVVTATYAKHCQILSEGFFAVMQPFNNEAALQVSCKGGAGFTTEVVPMAIRQFLTDTREILNMSNIIAHHHFVEGA